MTCPNRPTRLAARAAAVALLACLAACGGKPADSTVAAPQGAASGAGVTGISTASGVSVVTAKNAQ